MFVASDKHVCPKCNSYLDVSSKDYLIASDICTCLLFESWFRNPPKRTETRGKKLLKKLHFKLGLESVKRKDEKTQEHNPTMEWWLPPLWPPTQCTCTPSSLCCLQSELGMQVHCVGGQRRAPSFCSRAAFLSFFISAWFLSFSQVQPFSLGDTYLQTVFCRFGISYICWYKILLFWKMW